MDLEVEIPKKQLHITSLYAKYSEVQNWQCSCNFTDGSSLHRVSITWYKVVEKI